MVRKVVALAGLLAIIVMGSAQAMDGDSESSNIDLIDTGAATGAIDNNIVVTFGDSITNGKGATPYAVFLQQMSDANRCNFQVINQGKNGEATAAGVSRIDAVLNALRPRYILIMEGANDAIIGVSSATIINDIRVMIDKAKAVGSIPVVSAVTPNVQGGQENREIPDSINPGIAGAAGSRGVTFVNNYGALAGPNFSQYTIDGLHMNNTGQQIIAQQFFNALPCDGSGDSGGGCFIATAAYGSLLEPHVALLRQFRDEYLLTNSGGQAFVNYYYTYSPPIADYIAQHEGLKALVRVLLLPLIAVAYLLVNGVGYMIPAGMALLLVTMIGNRRRRKAMRPI